MKPKRVSKTKRVSVDRISNLPLNIIETILCLVPIKDAVRTSILSRNWRYNWTRIPKLVFDEKDLFDKSTNSHLLSYESDESDEEPPNERKELTRKCKLFYAIHQVLLLHHGPILEFALYMDADKTCVEIDQIITYLSRNNTLQKFTLHFMCNSRYSPYSLPSSVFSLVQLTDLYLNACILDFKPTFSGFGSLTNLYLEDVNISQKSLLRLISSSPLLKRFTLFLLEEYIIDGTKDTSTIIDLFECLPSIEHLTIWIFIVECFVHDAVPRELPTTLVHLKYLYLCHVTFIGYELPFLFLLIRSSPNLEKIKLEILEVVEEEIGSVTMENYSDIWLEHLKEFEIEDYYSTKLELEFVKLILAKSPMLKKVRISFDMWKGEAHEMNLLRILSRCPRASPVVEIIVS